jgi:hypothetical protein
MGTNSTSPPRREQLLRGMETGSDDDGEREWDKDEGTTTTMIATGTTAAASRLPR